MTGTADVRSIRDYLSFGFVPDAGLASQYLHELFGAPTAQAGNPTELLIEIVADLTAGATDLAIPLSGGRDSRALLAASLRTFSNRRIHCITFGPEGSPDVERARAVCRRTGVAHRIMDPDTLNWDLGELTDEMERRLIGRMGIPPIDGMLIFGALAKLIPSGAPVLSGYLGVVSTGKHLKDAVTDDESRAVARFLAQNRAVIDERSAAMFLEFMTAHEPLQGNWPGLTKFDLLDFGFRQRCRIRSSVTGAFKNVVRVYEDRRWIAQWFSQPLSARLSVEKYDEILGCDFPAIFGRQPILSRVRLWRAMTGGAAGKGVYRGDARRNPSMAAALEQACRSFDKRRIDVGQSATAAFDTHMREPSLATFRRIRWFATAEILARAQERNSPAEARE